MLKAELDKYRQALEARQTDLVRALRNRENIAIQQAPDTIDEVQFATEREFAIRNLDRESRLLRAVRAALARVADGSYGACLHCEREINRKRLDAVPWAAYCVPCQKLVDQQTGAEELFASLEDVA